VTGSAGFIGYHLCRDLLSFGHQVIGIDNHNRDYHTSLKEKNTTELQKFKNFEFIKLNIVNEGFSSILNGRKVDYVVHLAAKDLYYDKHDKIEYSPYLETNVVGTANIFELAKILAAKKFIFASTHSVYGVTKKGVFTEKDLIPRPISPHGASKLAAEQVVHFMSNFYELPAVVLRIFSTYGPGMRPHTLIPHIIDRLQEDRPLGLYADENQKRDYIYIDDVVEAIKAAFNKRIKFQAINIAGGDVISIRDLAIKIADLLGKNNLELAIERSEKDFSKVVVQHVNADVSRAKKILKFTPQVGLDAGLKKTVDWYLSHPDILKLSAP